MPTQAEIQSAYDRSIELIQARDVAYADFQSQIAAIDFGSANAQAQLDTVKTAIADWKSANSSALVDASQNFIAQLDAVPGSDSELVAFGIQLRDQWKANNSQINLTVNAQVEQAQAAISAEAKAADPTSTVKEPSSTNGVPEETNNDNGIDTAAQTGASTSSDTAPTNSWQEEVNRNKSTALPKGGTPPKPVAAQAQWSEAKDLRVKLRVPNEYLAGPAAGPSNIIKKNGGILFPYTPSISVENQASYASQSPLHSNYPLYFYKNSTIQPINVTAKFTVQNEFEGAVLLGVIHLLRGLTKMKFGNDPDAGSPPPVCRFDAYGDYMLYNVPVSIASWRHELPDNVDYISVGRKGSPTTYGHSMVPVLSTISLTLNVMYSRREMLSHNVKDWISGGLRYKGYL